jgi:undecaprenyl-diphosphatase
VIRVTERLPLIAFAIGLAAFVAMALLAASSDTFAGDLWAARQLQSVESNIFATPLDWTEDLAESPLVMIVAGAAALAFLLAGRWDAAVLMLGTQVSRIIVPLLKEAIERPRPSPDLVSVSSAPADFSFPSGHSFSAMLTFGLLFYLASVHVRPAVPRVALQIGCVWVAVATGLERVYAGHHWPSDVLGGFLAGGLFLALFAGLNRSHLLHRLRDRDGSHGTAVPALRRETGSA